MATSSAAGAFPADAGQPEPDAPIEFHVIEDAYHGDGEHEHDAETMRGFWIYLMSDSLIFGILFAVHAVLGQNYAAGLAPIGLFEIETITLPLSCCFSRRSPMASPWSTVTTTVS